MKSFLTADNSLVVWVLGLGAALLLLFPAGLLECDAVIYCCAGLGRDLIQSTDAGHLAWGVLEWGAADLGRQAAPPVHPVDLLRWLSVTSALAGAWLMYRLLMTLGLAARSSALLAGALLFSYSYWHFALQAEPHLPSTFFLIWFAWSVRRFGARPGVGGAALSALTLGLATLLHQSAILLVPAFILFALWRPERREVLLRYLPVFAALYGITVVVPYLGVAVLVRDLQTVAEIKAWILGLSSLNAWGYWTWATPVRSAVGFLRSIMGSHFMLGLDPMMAFANKTFPHASWDDERLLAGQVPSWLRYGLMVLETAVLGVLAVGAWRLPRRLRAGAPADQAYQAFLVAWLVVYGGFIMWWAPERAEFWIGVIVPLLVLAGLGLRGLAETPRHLSGLGAVVATLMLVNLLGSIRPQSRADLEPETRLLMAIDTVTARGDFLLSDSSLRGRATRFVYTLEKVNLLEPTVQRPGTASPRAEGMGPGRTVRPDWRAEAGDDPVGHALTVTDSVLVRAAREGKRVYLLKTPLQTDPERRARFAEIVAGIEQRHDLQPPVALRAQVELVPLIRRGRRAE